MNLNFGRGSGWRGDMRVAEPLGKRRVIRLKGAELFSNFDWEGLIGGGEEGEVAGIRQESWGEK
eukprot:621408-Amorphochlora_amoeboformis.AAC.2